MRFTRYSVLCLLPHLVNSVDNVAGAPEYTANWRFTEPTAPDVVGTRHASQGKYNQQDFLSALRAPNLTGTYSFAVPNISAPPGQDVDQGRHRTIPGWSLSVALKAGVPFEDDEHYVVGQIKLDVPSALVTNETGIGGQKNVSVAEGWEVCVIQWMLDSQPYPSKLRTDDGSCSSALSRGCIDALKSAVARVCSNPHIENLDACANDDVGPFRTSSISGYESPRLFPRGSAQLTAFASHAFAGGPGNLSAYNDLGTVAWPTVVTFGAGLGAAQSELICLRPTEAVNGSTLPVWEEKEQEEGGSGGDGNGGDGNGGDGDGGDGNGQGGNDEGAAGHIPIDKLSMFVLSAATMACLLLL